MPELPEVEITARLLDDAAAGASVQSALAPGINVLKSFDPPLSALQGRKLSRVRRRGKHIVIDFEGELVLLMHLMSAGRLQLYDKRAGPRDRTSRLLLRLQSPGEGQVELELRLREFGSKQAAWAKLMPSDALEQESALASLGPEAWPQAPELRDLLAVSRPLNALLRDQRTIAGIGRSWADEILWRAKLSPFKRGGDLDTGELVELRHQIETTLDQAISHYEQVLKLPIPDKLPMPLQIHGREGQPCPRCGATLGAVHFEEHVIAYCPACQTGGRTLKDRRLSRLLK
ncbi:MAG TPA: DNA-formamidopyrimidine glycosylase family protein [Solirubrobacteraceae bacterium]|jgi:formamidopyrimidine-DNA glycosylase